MRLIMLCAACGVGKSTIINELNTKRLLKDFVCVDTDEVGVNWWDWAGSENEDGFTRECLARAVKIADEKNLVFGACTSPDDFYRKGYKPDCVSSVFYIGLFCSDNEIEMRLKARPAERMCGSDEFIASQVKYNGWIRGNADKFDIMVDNTEITIEKAAEKIAEFVRSI